MEGLSTILVLDLLHFNIFIFPSFIRRMHIHPQTSMNIVHKIDIYTTATEKSSGFDVIFNDICDFILYYFISL